MSQQLLNSDFTNWTTQPYGLEPTSWVYLLNGNTVYGTNNFINDFEGIDPLTTTRLTGSQAFGNNGSSVLLETKSAISSTAISNGYITIPGEIYREDAINGNVGSISFKYKTNVVTGDSCGVKVWVLDNAGNILKYGEVFFSNQENTNVWSNYTLVLNQQNPGTPNKIIIDAMSTNDFNYTYNTNFVGSKFSLDNFQLNYCNGGNNYSVNDTICEYMLPYTWNNFVFNSSGSQTVNLLSSLGCDSIVTLNLTVVSGPFTTIPDIGFEEKLIQLGLDPCGVIDNLVPTNIISQVTSLNLSNLPNYISDLTGLEDFANLENLIIVRSASGPNVNLALNGINLSQNLALKKFWCKGCQLPSLDLSNNINLIELNLDPWQPTFGPFHQIGNLSLVNNNALKFINAEHSGLTSIELPLNSSLQKIKIPANFNLDQIDISTAPNLISLDVSFNNLNNIFGTNNASLNFLDASGNNNLISLPLSSKFIDTLKIANCGFYGLNLSEYTELKYLDCSSNNLTCLDLKNGVNTSLTYLNTLDNFILTCVEVDNVTFSSNNPIWNDNKSTWTTYSENCNYSCSTAALNSIDLQEFTIYPNPTNDRITVSGINIKQIELYDIQGKLLKFGSEKIIDLSGLSNGIYYVSITSEMNTKYIKPIIKE